MAVPLVYGGYLLGAAGVAALGAWYYAPGGGRDRLAEALSGTGSATPVPPSVQMERADHHGRTRTWATPRDAEACSDCEPEDPDCPALRQAIGERRAEVARRYAEMREDRFGLYPIRPMRIPGIGSWPGHVQQFQNQQRRLRDALEEAEGARCGPQGDAWQWATRDPPRQPAPR